MDPIQPKFFQTAFDIECDGATLNLRGLVSPAGITKIYLTSGLPDFWKLRIGNDVNVRLGTAEIPGVLLQQYVEHGTFYEIKFRELSLPVLGYLEQRMKAEGVSPGWQRKYPRIPVKGFEDPELPVPNLCMVRFVGQEIFVNVMNFTLGGLRIETLGDSLGELRVGAVLHFDLITSTGDILANLSGEVRNIAVHDHRTPEGSSLTRSFGMRFVDMDPVNERKYRTLIRDYCMILQKRLTSE
ncbi:MAG: PilZ domain-containing protein [Bdellovibrionota bacterium]